MRILILSFVVLCTMINHQANPNVSSKPKYAEELKSLEAERTGLQNKRNSIEGAQDFWHGLSVVLAVAAAALGIAAGASQRLESKRSYSIRNIDKRMAEIDSSTDVIRASESELAIAGLKMDTANANQRAGEANDAASEASKSAEQARLEQERLNRDNLVLQSQLEQEKIERLKLEEKYAPRKLSAKQKQDLADILRRYPSAHIPVITYVGTPDGGSFGADLIEAIKAGGWSSTERPAIVSGGGELRGLTIWIPDPNHPSDTARILQDALRSIGIIAPGQVTYESSPNGAALFIAPK